MGRCPGDQSRSSWTIPSNSAQFCSILLDSGQFWAILGNSITFEQLFDPGPRSRSSISANSGQPSGKLRRYPNIDAHFEQFASSLANSGQFDQETQHRETSAAAGCFRVALKREGGLVLSNSGHTAGYRRKSSRSGLDRRTWWLTPPRWRSSGLDDAYRGRSAQSGLDIRTCTNIQRYWPLLAPNSLR